MRFAILSVSFVALLAAAPISAQESSGYRVAPAPIAQILDTPPTPASSINPTGDTIVLVGRANLPPIAELAEPDVKLAGYRINPRNNGPANSRVGWLNSLTFKPATGGTERKVALPAGARFTRVGWAPNGKSLAFLLDRPTGLELWVADVATARARKVTPPLINAAAMTGYEWLPDSRGFLISAIPAKRGTKPALTSTPTGPNIQENMGRTAPVRTFQDLLGNRSDEAQFDYYFTAQPMLVTLDGKMRAAGSAGVYTGLSTAPNGRYILTEKVKRPYSYVVPARLFPTEVAVTDLAGRTVKTVASLLLRDDIPTQFDAVAKGPRSIEWRADAPATLVWAEALDGGDARAKAEVRDRVYMLAAPFTGSPTKLADVRDRYRGIVWGRDDYAMLVSGWWQTRKEVRSVVNPAQPGDSRILLERNYQDRYNDPGMPETRMNAAGRPVIHFSRDGRSLYMSGDGATREGAFPFLDRVDVASGKAERLWRAKTPDYESVLALLDDDAARFITRKENRTDPPNLFLRDRAAGRVTPLTAFPDPAPQLAGVTKKLLTYKRKDGVQLSGTLYLPAGYDKVRDGRLPVLMWAYPTEFTDAKVAGQVVDTQNRFTRPGGMSHLFMLTQGYAVLDNPTMPIVGEKGAEPNDTYVEQLVASAQAAADAVVAEGVGDRDRLAVGGHSYGAFMTANLLAHSDIFRAGIARSGAYNRTLTPFGFQAEQRSYWDAVDTYTKMSPFTYVKAINEPILLIHGEADDNSGTFPVQSERFYAALKGNGATVRYVTLPLEAHGYRARESVMHTLWEMTSWLDRYVKQAPPRK